jgi:tetratricopeptide (TPR) repeat protein
MLQDIGGAKGIHLLPLYEPAAGEGDAEAAYTIARIHEALGDKKSRHRAEIFFHRAAGLGHGRAAWKLGSLSEERGGDPQQAERWYMKAAGAGEKVPAYLAGCSMELRKAYAEAEPWLRTAWDHGIVESSYYLGRALRGLGRAEEAEEWLRRAVGRYADFGRERHGPGKLDPRPELAEFLVESGRDEDAAPIVADILAQYPGHLVGNRLAGGMARRRGDPETARRHFEELDE